MERVLIVVRYSPWERNSYASFTRTQPSKRREQSFLAMQFQLIIGKKSPENDGTKLLVLERQR